MVLRPQLPEVVVGLALLRLAATELAGRRGAEQAEAEQRHRRRLRNLGRVDELQARVSLQHGVVAEAVGRTDRGDALLLKQADGSAVMYGSLCSVVANTSDEPSTRFGK